MGQKAKRTPLENWRQAPSIYYQKEALEIRLSSLQTTIEIQMHYNPEKIDFHLILTYPLSR